MTCIICGSEIHPARLDVAPATVTCSRECSDENSKRIRRASADRWRAAQKQKGDHRG